MTTASGDTVIVARDVKGDHLVLSVCQGDVCIAVQLQQHEWERVVKSGETEAKAIRLRRHVK